MISALVKRALATVGLLAVSAGATRAQSDSAPLPAFTGDVNMILGGVLLVSLIAIAYGFFLRAQVLKLSPGTEAMQRVGEAIRDWAYAYLQKQVRTMLPLVGVLAVALFFLYNGQFGARVGFGTALAFLVGVSLSYAAGYIGMGMAVRGNQRTANQALTTYKGALETSFRSGAVAGMMTVGLGLLGATAFFLIYQNDAMKVLVGFGFGGSLAALFMRVGGGIFTKAADVRRGPGRQDRAGHPRRRPAQRGDDADNVGDNVGDCAGMAADVFESYLVTLVAAMILGAAVGGSLALPLILFPLVIHGVGILASIFGIASMRGKEDMSLDPLKPINGGFLLTAILALIGVAAVAYLPSLLGSHVTINGQAYERGVSWRRRPSVSCWRL